MIALLSGAHEGNTAATAVEDRMSRAPGDKCARALQDASSVSCPGRAVLDKFVRLRASTDGVQSAKPAPRKRTTRQPSGSSKVMLFASQYGFWGSTLRCPLLSSRAATASTAPGSVRYRTNRLSLLGATPGLPFA